MSSSWVGTSVKRVEDPALLRGEGRFVDDIHRAGMLHAAMVRSPFAHARIAHIDAGAALGLDGVHAVVTFADLPAQMQRRTLPMLQPNPAVRTPRMPWALARDEVCYVGDPVAVVVAEDRYLAEDAGELVQVDYEPLGVAADVRDAVLEGAPCAHADADTNINAEIDIGYGAIDAQFAKAAHRVTGRFFQHRGTAHPIECRALIAELDEDADEMRVWVNTQTPHLYRDAYADLMGVAGAPDPRHHPGRFRGRLRSQGAALQRALRDSGLRPDSRPPGEVDRGSPRALPDRLHGA